MQLLLYVPCGLCTTLSSIELGVDAHLYVFSFIIITIIKEVLSQL